MKKAVSILALLIMSGCIPSLHAIYQPKDLVFDPKLVGEWSEPSAQDSWKFAKLDATSYRFTYTDRGGVKSNFKACLAKTEGMTLLDLTPEKDGIGGNELYKAYLLPLHTFFCVEKLDADNLELASMDYGWFKQHLKANPDAIAHEKVDETVILTASSQEIQAFLLKHRQTAGAFTKLPKMTRR